MSKVLTLVISIALLIVLTGLLVGTSEIGKLTQPSGILFELLKPISLFGLIFGQFRNGERWRKPFLYFSVFYTAFYLGAVDIIKFGNPLATVILAVIAVSLIWADIFEFGKLPKKAIYLPLMALSIAVTFLFA